MAWIRQDLQTSFTLVMSQVVHRYLQKTHLCSLRNLLDRVNSLFIHNMSYQNGGQDSEVTGIGLCLQNTSYFDLEKMSVYQNWPQNMSLLKRISQTPPKSAGFFPHLQIRNLQCECEPMRGYESRHFLEHFTKHTGAKCRAWLRTC